MAYHKESLFKTPVKVLTLCGYLNARPFSKIYMYTAFCFYIFLESLTIMQFFYLDGDLEKFIAGAEALTSYSQVTCKALTLMLLKTDFMTLLKMRQSFWNYDILGKAIAKEETIYLKIVFISFNMLYIFSAVTLVLMFLKPFLVHETPHACWIPDGEVWFWSISLLQMVTLSYGCTMVCSFEVFASLFYCEVAVQLNLFNRVLSRIVNRRDIKQCVDYHDFILKYIKKLNSTYSVYFLVQYFMSMVTICSQILIMIDSNKVEIRFKAISYCATCLLQLTFYCMPVSVLQDASDETMTSAIFCNWLSAADKTCTKDLRFMMIHYRKRLSVKASGLFEMDRNAYINVCRSAFSIYTLLSTMKS